MIKIPKELFRLADIFQNYNHKLYIVGGYIRDSLLSIESNINDDIDLCSDATPSEIRKMLFDSEFKVGTLNDFVGVLEIKGKRRYEHATFREESYDNDSHNPTKVNFIKDLEKDCIRRDFKINAIYYDIIGGEIIDPLGGLNNLKERKVETVRDAKYVFDKDPERILRLIRFSCSLGFDIPEKEIKYAKKNSNKICCISKYRLKTEFEKLLNCDQIYPELPYTSDAHFRAMILIGEFGIWKYILPAVEEIKNSNIKDKKGELIYDHTLNCLKQASPDIRMAILLHDAAKLRTMISRNNFFGAKEYVEVIVNKNLGLEGLGYNKDYVKRISKIILGYDFNNYCFANKNSIKQFIFKNKECIENIIEIKNTIKNENREKFKINKSAEKLRNVYKEMIKNEAPFQLSQLNIRGNDIIEKYPDVKLENLDVLLDNILILTAIKPQKNNKKELLIMANKLINSNRDFYLD